jgi:hypothetical protein
LYQRRRFCEALKIMWTSCGRQDGIFKTFKGGFMLERETKENSLTEETVPHIVTSPSLW